MLRIVIADDHAIVRKGLRQLITEEYPTAEIAEAGDVESLIMFIIKEKWDLVICDISMPGRSGLEALEQIKEIAPGLPVLMMSMHPEDQYALRVFKSGAAGFLSKDSVHEELLSAISMIRNGRKFITPSVAEKLAGAIRIETMKELHEYLSNREFDIFKMLASGKSVSKIAEQLSLSATTISTYRTRILDKMAMKTNADLTRYAIEKKLI